MTHDPLRKQAFHVEFLYAEPTDVTIYRDQRGIVWECEHPRLPIREKYKGPPYGRYLSNGFLNWATTIGDAIRTVSQYIDLVRCWTIPEQERDSYQIRFCSYVLHIRPFIHGWELSDGPLLIAHGDITPENSLLAALVHNQMQTTDFSQLLRKAQRAYDCHIPARLAQKRGQYIYSENGKIE